MEVPLIIEGGKYFIFDGDPVDTAAIGELLIQGSELAVNTITSLFVEGCPYISLPVDEQTFLDSLKWLTPAMKIYDGIFQDIVLTHCYSEYLKYMKDPDKYLDKRLDDCLDHAYEKVRAIFSGYEFPERSIAKLFFIIFVSLFENKASMGLALLKIVTGEDLNSLTMFFSRQWFSAQEIGFRIAIKNDKFIPAYSIGTLPSLMLFEVYNILENKVTIKTCPNCNRYFVPESRSDTVYCSRPAPQDEAKTCREYGKYINFLTKTQTDEATKLYRQIFNQKNNKARRCKTKEAPEGNPVLNKDVEDFKKQAKQWKSNIKTGIETEAGYINWLRSIKGKDGGAGGEQD